MICKVREALKKYGMCIEGRRICVALSGGADSMSLLYAMLELRDEMKLTVTACHVNHGIRGEAADRDEKFVREQCEKLGVRLDVLHADVPRLAEERGTGLEECGRQVRYEFFSSLGDDVLIATAHTLSDRCETLLLNITRGSGLKGLSSIPPKRGNIIRPLIDCTRQDIENYCAEKGIEFVTDETNSDDVYSRNRVRLNVIPQLKKINPAFEQAVMRLTDSVSDDEEYLISRAVEFFKEIKSENGYDAVKLSSAPPSIRRRVLGIIISTEGGVTPEAVHISMAESILTGGRTEIIGNTVIEVKNGMLRVNPKKEEFSEWEVKFENFSAETPFGRVSGRIVNKKALPRQQFVHNNVLDYDSIAGDCTVRNRRAGDIMRRAGSSCTKKLKKLFTELHIDNRDNAPVLCDSQGILWVRGIGCADRCKITEKTENVLLIGEENND